MSQAQMEATYEVAPRFSQTLTASPPPISAAVEVPMSMSITREATAERKVRRGGWRSQSLNAVNKPLASDPLTSLPTGWVRFDVPLQMTVGKEETASITISAFREALNETTTTIVEAIKISRRMTARLAGNAFTIDPTGDREQLVGDQQTIWTWQVTPKEPGVHRLLVTVAVILPDAPPHVYITKQASITVSVAPTPNRSVWEIIGGFLKYLGEGTTTEFAKKLGGIVLAGLGAGATTLWIKWRRSRRRAKQISPKRESARPQATSAKDDPHV